MTVSNFDRPDQIPVHRLPIGTLRIFSGQAADGLLGQARAGTHTPAHQRPGEQMTWLLSGRLRYRLGGGEPRDFAPGDVVLIPAGVEHKAWYVDECEIVEFHAPPRFDLYPAAREHPHAIG